MSFCLIRFNFLLEKIHILSRWYWFGHGYNFCARIVRSRDKGTIKGGKSFLEVGGARAILVFLFFVSIFSIYYFFEILDCDRKFFLWGRNVAIKRCLFFLSFFMLIIFNSTFEHYFFVVFQKSRKIWIKNVNFQAWQGFQGGSSRLGFKNKIRKTESSGR